MFKIQLPDQSFREFSSQPSALDVAKAIGSRLAKDTLGVKINGSKEISDLRTVLKDGDRIELVTTRSDEANEVIRHSCAHVMAQAVQSLWPEVKVTIGPVIDDGFYYDFDSPFSFTEEHFAQIEKKMEEIVTADLPLVRESWSKARAIETFNKMGERFKVELIESIPDSEVGIYHQGSWFDLCRGPHVQSTGQIKSFKILHTAGAYWRGNEKNPMLQRIYATAFKDKKELEEYLHQREEANKRDHRKLGREMGLFIHHPWAPGSPFFTGKGAIIYNELLTYIRDLYFKYGYQEVITPQIFDTEMFKVSGHYQHYKESMYFSHLEEREFGSKPMNCPGHCLLFASEKHSYRELPMRIADFGRLHRYERSGAMHGITRVRSFCQDDAHIFCSLDGLQEEIRNFVELLNEVYNQLGIGQYKVLLATRPESRMGTDEVWDKSEGALSNALKALNVPFEYAPGEGAFYGPKLEFHMVDAIKRSWQMGTIQVDYNLPEAFDLKFTGVDNKEHRPVMLHRAVLGSLERFIGVYLEHMSGHLPLWLAPEQVAILNVTDRVNDYCEGLQKELRSQKVRAEFDYRNEKLNYKIREAQMRRVPLMFIIGDKEKETGTVSVRFANGKMQSGLDQKQVIAGIYKEIRNRSLEIRF